MKFRKLFLVGSFAVLASCALSLLSCSSGDEDGTVEENKLIPATSKVKNWAYGEQSLNHAKAIVAFGPRPAESVALEKTRQYIEAELEKRGWAVQRQSFVDETPEGKKQFVNLFARYQGKDDVKAVWTRKHKGVLGAHIDTKKIPGIEYLGAADAAASVGMVIEAGDFLAKHFPEEAKGLELVFFDGEEAIGQDMYYEAGLKDGLYGSHYYAKKRNGRRNFGVILDLLGVKDQVVRMPSDSPDRLFRLVKKIAKEHKVQDKFVKAPAPILDDHVPLNFFGCPTIDIIGEFGTDNSKWWHSEGDTLEILSEKQIGMNLKVVLDLLVGELRK